MRAKELDDIANRKATVKPACASANKSPKLSLSPEEDYCTVFTPVGRLCPSEFAGCQDWEDSKEEKENDQGKREGNFSVCSDWYTDLKEQDKKNQQVENKEDI